MRTAPWSLNSISCYSSNLFVSLKQCRCKPHARNTSGLRLSGQQCLNAKLSFIFLMNNLQTTARVLYRDKAMNLCQYLSFTRYFFKLFCVITRVQNMCKLHFLKKFLFVCLFCFVFRILSIEMLYVYQRVESIHETQTGFLSLFNDYQ